MAITSATIEALQMLRGLSMLTIEDCYFDEDALTRFHHMLMPHNREPHLPNIRFLRISGFHPSSEPTEEEPYERIDTKQLIADATSTPSQLHIEAGGFKYWRSHYKWNAYQKNGTFVNQ
jgi:hypothetical protein